MLRACWLASSDQYPCRRQPGLGWAPAAAALDYVAFDAAAAGVFAQSIARPRSNVCRARRAAIKTRCGVGGRHVARDFFVAIPPRGLFVLRVPLVRPCSSMRIPGLDGAVARLVFYAPAGLPALKSDARFTPCDTRTPVYIALGDARQRGARSRSSGR
jgi:hypothetical protein